MDMRRKRIFNQLSSLLLLFYFLWIKPLQAQESFGDFGPLKTQNELVAKGNALFKNSQYQQALALYDSALKSIGQDEAAEYIIALHRKGDALINLNKPFKARHFLEQALSQSNDNFGYNSEYTASSLYYLGKAMSNQSKAFKESAKYSDQSVGIRIALYGGAGAALGQSLNMRGTAEMYQGQYNEAMATYKAALKAWEEADTDALIHEKSRAYYGLGWINIAMGNPLAATRYLEQSLEINQAVFHTAHGRISNDLNLLGRAYTDLAQMDKALEVLDQTLYLRKTNFGEDHPNVGQTYSSMATLFANTGQPNRAIEHMQQAIRIFKLNPQGNTIALTDAYTSIFDFYQRIGNKEAQQEAIEQALIFAQNLKANNPRLLATYLNAADFAFSQKNMSDYDKYIAKSEQIASKSFGRDHPFYASVITKKATYAMQLQDHRQAQSWAREALDIVKRRRPKGHHNQIINRILMARTFYRNNELDSALHYCEEAIRFSLIEESVTDGGESVFDISHTPLQIIEATYLRAMILRRAYELDKDISALKEALASYRKALSYLESTRNRFLIDRQGQNIFRLAEHVPNEAISVAYELYQLVQDKGTLEAALDISERSKGFVFLKTLDQKQSLSFGNIPDSLTQKDVDLVSQIRYYSQLRRNAFLRNQKERLEKYRKQVFDLRQEREALIKKIEQFHPDFYGLKYKPDVISLSELQAKLAQDGQALVEYTVTDDYIFQLVVTPTKTQFSRQEKPADLKEKIARYRQSYTDYNFLVDHKARADSIFTNTGHTLYQSLLGTAASTLEGIDELIIVPHNVLYVLNFDVLLTETAPKNFQYGDLAYLAKDKAITYANSYTTHDKLSHTVRPPFRNNFGGFATSLQATNDQLEALAVTDIAMRGPGSQTEATIREVEGVAEMLNGDTYLNDAATEENFKNLKGNYQVVHLAMHGSIDQENPFNSALIFSANEDDEEDGYLTMNEIYEMELNSDLLVLSACNTGFHRVGMSSEGLMSMSRGFMFSGVSSMVMTQWSIPDETTADVMLGFYKHLNQGESKPMALQLAKREYLANLDDDFYAHPFFWAGLTQIGNTAPLKFAQQNSLLYIISFLIFSLGVALIFIQKRRALKQVQ